MSTQHVSWGSIELLHNVVRTLTLLAEQGQPLPVIAYRAKIKLHGTNCAVQVTATGPIAQSRNLILTREQDHKGFAAWVHTRGEFWASLAHGLTVFGEWCGPGVEKGMAISQAAHKMFCVFAIRVQGEHGERQIHDPDELERMLPGRPADVHVLPWEGAPISIDFAARDALAKVAEELNGLVADVEREDPWCKRALGISGLGEGLVFYPEPFDQALMFKAKGDKHRTAGKKAVQVDASVAGSIDELVALVVTDARLAQGLAAIGGEHDPKKTAAFIAWIAADVKKESVAELEAAKLTWAQVERAVQARARAWFLRGGL